MYENIFIIHARDQSVHKIISQIDLDEWDSYSIGREGSLLQSKNGAKSSTIAIKDIDFTPDPVIAKGLKEWWSKNIDTDRTTRFNKEYFINLFGNADMYVASIAPPYPIACITPNGVLHRAGLNIEDIEQWFADFNKKYIEPYKDDMVITVVRFHKKPEDVN